MRASLLAFGSMLGTFAWPALAGAQLDDQPLPGDSTADMEVVGDRTYQGGWWGDLGFYTGDETPDGAEALGAPATTATLIAPVFGGTYKLANLPLAFEARAGLVVAFLSAEGADTLSTVRLTNPLLAAYWADRFGRVDVQAGLGFGLPVASIRDGSLEDAAVDASAYFLTAGANGLWDFYQWLPDRFTLLIPASVEARVGAHLVLGAQMGLHILFSTAGDTTTTEGGVTVTTSGGDTESIFQLGGEVAYRSRSTRTGLVLRVVDMLSGGDGDNTQFSVEPYLRFELAPGFFRIALTVNLDEPFGFSFESGPSKLWCLHVGGGTQF